MRIFRPVKLQRWETSAEVGFVVDGINSDTNPDTYHVLQGTNAHTLLDKVVGEGGGAEGHSQLCRVAAAPAAGTSGSSLSPWPAPGGWAAPSWRGPRPTPAPPGTPCARTLAAAPSPGSRGVRNRHHRPCHRRNPPVPPASYGPFFFVQRRLHRRSRSRSRRSRRNRRRYRYYCRVQRPPLLSPCCYGDPMRSRRRASAAWCVPLSAASTLWRGDDDNEQGQGAGNSVSRGGGGLLVRLLGRAVQEGEGFAELTAGDGAHARAHTRAHTRAACMCVCV